MDHDIFEHLGTSHIIRWGEGSVDFFLGGGLGGTEGDESSPTEYQGGDYRKLTVGGGKFYRDTTKFSAPHHPPTPDDEQWPVPKMQLFC